MYNNSYTCNFNKYITTTYDEINGYSYEWKEKDLEGNIINIPEVLNQAYTENQGYIASYLQYVQYADNRQRVAE